MKNFRDYVSEAYKRSNKPVNFKSKIGIVVNKGNKKALFYLNNNLPMKYILIKIDNYGLNCKETFGSIRKSLKNKDILNGCKFTGSTFEEFNGPYTENGAFAYPDVGTLEKIEKIAFESCDYIISDDDDDDSLPWIKSKSGVEGVADQFMDEMNW